MVAPFATVRPENAHEKAYANAQATRRHAQLTPLQSFREAQRFRTGKTDIYEKHYKDTVFAA